MKKSTLHTLEIKLKNAADSIFEKIVLPYETNLDNQPEYKRSYYKSVSNVSNYIITLLSYTEHRIRRFREDMGKIFNKNPIEKKRRLFDSSKPLYLDYNGNISPTKKTNQYI